MAANAREILVDAPAREPVMHLTRVFNAPRELVWDCFTKAEHMAQWWGPCKYAITVHEFDVRPSGKWKISHADGTKTVTFFGEYREVVKPESLSRTFCFGDFPPIEESYVFYDEDGKTRLTCTQRYPNVIARDMMAKGGAAEGGHESFERLDELLASLKG